MDWFSIQMPTPLQQCPTSTFVALAACLRYESSWTYPNRVVSLNLNQSISGSRGHHEMIWGWGNDCKMKDAGGRRRAGINEVNFSAQDPKERHLVFPSGP